MPRIAPVARGQSDAATNATLDTVKAEVGMVPNLYATFYTNHIAATDVDFPTVKVNL